MNNSSPVANKIQAADDEWMTGKITRLVMIRLMMLPTAVQLDTIRLHQRSSNHSPNLIQLGQYQR